MSDSYMQSNKIGARQLTRQEAELILPTYGQIFEQLETFRKEKKSVNINDQKTNNIGIIGVRGAGKTSVLKTIRSELEEDGAQDMILPIIVPENMSESGTLMATVLGMLGDIVHKCVREEEEREKGKKAYCIRENKLEQKYHNVLKQYTYIQKEYRDILIQQYTSENDYVKSSAKIFNSDTEFIKQFNELIEELVGTKNEARSLLVLFIDDIDLSTWRCMDVVKTLLSYLANKNIVTFISGDLETFEEALTLEFLRQEKVLDGGMLEKTILAKGAAEKTLLESKKQLAYEYLKKILPPVYRHNIKEWSLEERGRYCNDGGEKQGVLFFSKLLDEALRDWVDPAFFRYMEPNGEKGVIPYTYHLFDNTSRGLNNVYNVLVDVVQSRKADKADDENDFCLKEKKQLLDTIIASHKIYNQYRNELQSRMITVGGLPENSKVYFDNAYSYIYGKEKNEKGERYKITDPVERFSLFILVDFAARLLYEKKYAVIVEKDESYQQMKQDAVWDMFCHPVIAEKVVDMEGRELIGREDGYRQGEGRKNENEALRAFRATNNSFLRKGDLTFNLAYYKNLSLNRVLALYQEGNSYSSDADLEQEIVTAFWRAVSSIAEISGMKAEQKLGECYYEFKEEMDRFMSIISTSVEQNIIIRLFDPECDQVMKKLAEMDQVYGRRILQNTIAKLLEDEIREGNSVKWEEVDLKKAWPIDADKFGEENDKEKQKRKRRIAVLKAIHEKQLWREEMAEPPIEYLKKELAQSLEYIGRALEGTAGPTDVKWLLDTSCAEEDWKEFLNSYHGVSATKALQTKQGVSVILMRESGGAATFTKGISLNACEEIKVLLLNLANNNRVRYGQYNAWKIERDLWEAWVRPAEGWDSSERYSYIKFLFQCCYRYKLAVEFDGLNMEYAELLRDIALGISEAHGYAYEKVQSTFLEKINENLEEKQEKPMGSEEFDELFH